MSTTPADLLADGYRVELGTEQTPGYDGQYWWTQCKPGWIEVRVSEGYWDSVNECVADAYRDMREHQGVLS